MNTQNKQQQTFKPYTYQNQDQFPFLTKIKHFQRDKQHGLNQTNWSSFLTQSGSLFNKWFNWLGPQFILFEIDQNNKKVKIFEQHSRIQNKLILSQHKLKQQIILTEVRTFNEKIQLNLRKNFVNGGISPCLTYNWVKYGQQQKDNQIQKINKIGVKLDYKKWLNNNLTTNQKKLFFTTQGNVKQSIFPFDLFKMYQVSIYLANRQNYYQPSKDKNTIITESIVKKSSDIIGYKLSTYYNDLGLQLGLKGGYDYFNKYNFNQLILRYGNYREFQRYVLQFNTKAGIVFGKNIMENDLLNRNKVKWAQDKSRQFITSRVNFILKNFHPIFGGVFQIVPLFYLEGCISRNNKQIKTKYQLDYGIGIRLLSLGITFDTSLIRLGKNLDDINSSFRIIF